MHLFHNDFVLSCCKKASLTHLIVRRLYVEYDQWYKREKLWSRVYKNLTYLEQKWRLLSEHEMDTLLSYLSALAAQQAELHTLPVSLLPPPGWELWSGGRRQQGSGMDGSIVDLYTHIKYTDVATGIESLFWRCLRGEINIYRHDVDDKRLKWLLSVSV